MDKRVTNKFPEALKSFNPKIRIMSRGSSLEIYKEIGLPEQVTQRFNIPKMTGRHGIGHTRLHQLHINLYENYGQNITTCLFL